MSQKHMQVYELLTDLGGDEWHTIEDIFLEHKARGGTIERYEMTAVLNAMKSSPTYSKRIEWKRGYYRALTKLEAVPAPEKQDEAPWDVRPSGHKHRNYLRNLLGDLVDTLDKAEKDPSRIDATQASDAITRLNSVRRLWGIPFKEYEA